MEATVKGGEGLLLVVLLAAGWVVGGAWERVAERISTGSDPVRVMRASGSRWVGSLIPVAAWAWMSGLFSTAIAAAAGLLLLGVVVCDEGTLRVPHAISGIGVGLGLGVAAVACGWPGALRRAGAVVLLTLVLAAAAEVGRRIAGRPALGVGDFGVLAFLSSLGGIGAAPDLLLLGGLLALAWTVVHSAPERRKAAYAALGVLAVILVGLLGFPGAVVGGLALVLGVRREVSAQAAAPAPLGACVCAAVFLLLLPLPSFASAAAAILHTQGCR
jgi:hypothetical protein